MNVEECILGRRSIRSYTDDPVGDDAIRAVVDLAKFSPSWANTQCVSYLVVRDPGTRAELASIMSPNNPGKEAVKTAPAVVVFTARTGLAGCKKGEPVDDRAWHMFDAGAAVQTFCLAAHAVGLGTVVVGYFDYRQAARILGLPAGTEAVAFTPVGVPARVPPAPARRETSDLLSFEHKAGPR